MAGELFFTREKTLLPPGGGVIGSTELQKAQKPSRCGTPIRQTRLRSVLSSFAANAYAAPIVGQELDAGPD
jgi:hypothetical protein